MSNADGYSSYAGKTSRVAPAPVTELSSMTKEEIEAPAVAEREKRNHSSGLFEFANSEVIREKVRKAKEKKEKYDVKTLYKEEGFAQRIARHQWFENFTLGVIIVNAIWIGIETDENPAATMLDAAPIFVIADILFFGYFFVELVIRFLAFKKKVNCLKDGWFVFDSCLVTLYLFDPFVLSLIIKVLRDQSGGGGDVELPTDVLRLFRLARLSRLVRMLRSLPELMIMIKGIFTAAASVSYTLMLLLVITYFFAVALTQLSVGYEFRETFFTGVGLSMYSLVIYGTFLDNLADFGDAIRHESTLCLMVATLFVVLANMTVLNMLIGVLCEVISAVAEEERESMITDKVHEKFKNIVKDLDTDQSGNVSWAEFQNIIIMPEAISALESVNVDPEGMIDFAQDWFQEDGQEKAISFQEFMNIVLELRGGQQATLKDLMLMNKRANGKFSSLRGRMEKIDEKLESLIDQAAEAQR